MAWGNDSAGQTSVPADLSNVVAIAAGGSHSLALGADGLIRAWGQNSAGQIRVPAGLTNVIALAAGTNHSLALRADGTVTGWGDNEFGQITVPTNLSGVFAITAGGNHSLALRGDGTVVAWGDNSFGQGNVPTGLVNVVAIAAGSFHSLALDKSGNVLAWGGGLTNREVYPELGQSLVPGTVKNVSAISAGDTHSLALAEDGAPFITQSPVSRIADSGPPVTFCVVATGALPLAYQWQLNGVDIPGATGRLLTIANAQTNNAGEYRVIVTNRFGRAVSSAACLALRESPPIIAVQPSNQQLYLGSRTVLQAVVYGSRPMFCQWRFNGTDLPGATNTTLILDRLRQDEVGFYYLVASNALGEVNTAKAYVNAVQTIAWGQNNADQATVPAGLAGVVSVAGGLYHTVALRQDGTVTAWGANSVTVSEYNYGQCNVPSDLANAVAVAAGSYHSLALKSDGTVVAWGAGGPNPIGTSFYNAGQSLVPAGLNNVIAIAAGQLNSMALKNDGSVVVWGSSTWSNVPPAARYAIAISERDYNFAILRPNGSVLEWGQNGWYQPTSSDIIGIALGSSFGLGLRSSGKVFTWGNGLGVPLGLSNAVQIAAGGTQALAVTGDGKAWAWGNGFPASPMPAGLSNVIEVACGENHSLAVIGDGSPVIQNQPVDETAVVGGPIFLLGVAGGLHPLGYQWYCNGAALPGATNSWLALNNPQVSDSGGYSLVVTNLYGSVTSRVARLSVVWNIAQAAESRGLTWTNTGNAPWFGQTNFTHDGILAAQSGRIGDSQQSSIQTAITGPGTLSFWWKVSSEEWFDFLEFDIDGMQQTAISGEVDWQPLTLRISNGPHALSWTYAKDPSGSAGLDAGWVAQVSFVPDLPIIIQQPISQTVEPGQTVFLSVQAMGAPPLSYQWSKDGTNLAGATATSYSLVAGGSGDSGAYVVAVSNAFGTTLSGNALVRVRVPQRLGAALAAGGQFTLLSVDSDGSAVALVDVPNYVLQASTDLVSWQTLASPPVLTNGVLLFLDPYASNYAARYYRVVEQ